MSRVQRAKGGASHLIFNRPLKIAQKGRSAEHKETPSYQAAFDFPLMNLVKRMQGIKKDFKNIAFVGPNPYLFLQHLPKGYEIEKFYFCESSQRSVERSYELITQKNESIYEKLGCNVPNEIIPTVVDEGDPE